jgi:hypothetical protein
MPQLSISGDVGTRFALEYAPALTEAITWHGLLTNTLTGIPFKHVDTTASGNSSRYYRVKPVP